MLLNPFRFGSAPAGDPNWASVRSLLHFEAANGTTALTDLTGKVWDRLGSGTREISTAQFKFGSSSLRISGVGVYNGYRENVSSNIWDSAAGGFTWEFFFRADSLTGTQALSSNEGASAGYDSTINLSSSGISLTSGGSLNIAAGGSVSANAWHHVAVEKSGTAVTLYLNGVLVGSSTQSGSSSGGKLTLAIGSNGSSAFSGFIDAFRFTKGVVRYGGPFTPPTSPFPSS